MMNAPLVSAADLERETGLGKDLLRKWRSRYGFPIPVREQDGQQGYSRNQMQQLRLIRHLQDCGFRPAQLVGKPLTELDRLLATVSPRDAHGHWSPVTREAIARLKNHDIVGLENLLRTRRAEQSLADFVAQTLAPLTVALGDAWAAGEIQVYQEHLCTDVLMRLLHGEIGSTRPRPGFPRVIFATARDEHHGLGLLMAQAVFCDLGAQGIGVGPHIPLGDLVLAARNCQAQIVALSFSFAYPPRRVRPMLKELRALLPKTVDIWAGGAGVQGIKRPPAGIRIFSDLRTASQALLAKVSHEQ